MRDVLGVRRVIFLREQDGPVERSLKDQIATSLAKNIEVKKAYLVRVRYGDDRNESVALCLKGGDPSAHEIVEKVGRLFNDMFNQTQRLDIIFLTEAQELELRPIAHPFYGTDQDGNLRVN